MFDFETDCGHIGPSPNCDVTEQDFENIGQTIVKNVVK